jgi:hypothetical protein
MPKWVSGTIKNTAGMGLGAEMRCPAPSFAQGLLIDGDWSEEEIEAEDDPLNWAWTRAVWYLVLQLGQNQASAGPESAAIPAQD